MRSSNLCICSIKKTGRPTRKNTAFVHVHLTKLQTSLSLLSTFNLDTQQEQLSPSLFLSPSNPNTNHAASGPGLFMRIRLVHIPPSGLNSSCGEQKGGGEQEESRLRCWRSSLCVSVCVCVTMEEGIICCSWTGAEVDPVLIPWGDTLAECG